jgi:hypothetical protein
MILLQQDPNIKERGSDMKKRQLLLPIVFSAVLFSCTTREFIKFNPATLQNYSERNAPAEIGTKNEEYYLSHGYVKIGSLSVKQIESNTLAGNEKFTYPDDCTTVLRINAAKNGGDIVVLTQNNTAGVEDVRENGKCIRSHIERQPRTVFIQGSSGAGTTGRLETVYDTVIICDEFEILTGKQYFKTSGGSVFRKL